jgi:hypothetical protein
MRLETVPSPAEMLAELRAEYPAFDVCRRPGPDGMTWEARRRGWPGEGLYAVGSADVVELRRELDMAMAAELRRLAAEFPHVTMAIVAGWRGRRAFEAVCAPAGEGLRYALRTPDAVELRRELAAAGAGWRELMPAGP